MPSASNAARAAAAALLAPAPVAGGEPLALLREPDTPCDPNAVRVEWRCWRPGHVPRRENAAPAWALERGIAARARISGLERHPNPARRIRFEVYVE